MRVAGVDPAACDEGAIGFRLAPRINASGRLGRPEAALALLLTDDPAEAKRLAEQLEELNRERQAVEERILRAAIAEIESWPEPRRRHRGYVVAGEDWHEGVIGIVASRLVERYGRPVVLIAGSASGGDWKGSGRAGGVVRPARRAHGLRRSTSSASAATAPRPASRSAPTGVEAFADGVRRARRRRAHRRRPAAAHSPSTRSCAAPSSGCRSARSSPGSRRSGSATPASRCSSTTASSTGSTRSATGKHLRFRVRQRGRDAGSAIAFGFGSQLDRYRRIGRYDVAFRLRRTAGTARSRRSSSSGASSTPTSATRSSAPGSREQWRRGEAAWTPEVRAVFDELGLSRRRAVAEPARVGGLPAAPARGAAALAEAA